MPTIYTSFRTFGATPVPGEWYKACDRELIEADVRMAVGHWATLGGTAIVNRDIHVVVTSSYEETCDALGNTADIVIFISRAPQKAVGANVVVTKPEYVGRVLVDTIAKLCNVQVPS